MNIVIESTPPKKKKREISEWLSLTMSQNEDTSQTYLEFLKW